MRRRLAMLSSFAVLTLSMASTGTVAPASAEGGFLTSILDTDGDGGHHTSIALNADGFPVVAYQNLSQEILKVAVCSDRSCANDTTVNTVDAVKGVGGFASLELNASGFPVIAYFSNPERSLKLATCRDTTCTLAPTILTIESGGTPGRYASLELDGQDAPVISYFHDSDKALKLARCNDAACGSPTITTVDDAGQVGTFTSLALTGEGIPVISYANFDPFTTVKVAVCSVGDCATGTSVNTVATPVAAVDSMTSLALNGVTPVVSFATAAGVELVTCIDALCADTTNTVVDSNAGGFASLALSSSGFPVISYWKQPGTLLMVAICGHATCGTTAVPLLTSITVDTSNAGRYSSLALDESGNPVISSYGDADGYPHLASIPATTVDVYAGAASTAPPVPDQPPDAAGATPAATQAKLGWPTDMVFDDLGNLYFSDRANHTVRMVAADGWAVSTVAGTPGVRCPDPTTTPACGDGAAATSALLRSPWGLALDHETPQNLYISDYGSHRVRKVTAGTGVITTIAGTGVAGYDGEGSATSRRLNYPSGLTVDDSGAVLVADRGNHRIRKIETGGAITTFLGTGTAGPSAPECSTMGSTGCMLDQPTDIEVRGSPAIPSELSDTDFFIADRGNDAVLGTFDGESDGIGVSRIGTGIAGNDDGDLMTAQFDQPLGLAYDALHGLLYIADSHNLTVRRFSMVDYRTTTVAGNGTGKLGTGSYVPPGNGGGDALRTALNFPIGIAFLPSGDQTQGSLYVSAVYENQIRKLAIVPPLPPTPV